MVIAAQRAAAKRFVRQQVTSESPPFPFLHAKIALPWHRITDLCSSVEGMVGLACFHRPWREATATLSPRLIFHLR